MKGGKIMKDKKGLSTIVVTLIIVVLSLVAVGVVWAVVNGLLKSGTQSADITTKCLGVSVEATKANCTIIGSPGNKFCAVALTRTGSGSDPIAGVRLIFSNSSSGTVGSSSLDIPGDVAPLASKIAMLSGSTSAALNTTLITSVGVDNVKVAVYFTDSSGNQQLCQQQSSFDFKG